MLIFLAKNMAKLKTKKAILSRLKVTGKRKLIRRASNQSHFNAKTSGKQRRLKRRVLLVKNPDIKLFKRYLPYN